MSAAGELQIVYVIILQHYQTESNFWDASFGQGSWYESRQSWWHWFRWKPPLFLP